MIAEASIVELPKSTEDPGLVREAAELLVSELSPDEDGTVESDILKEIELMDGRIALAAMKGAAVLGAGVFDLSSNPDIGNITHLAVSSEHRDHGIGRGMIRAAEAMAMDAGISCLTVSPLFDVRNFYKRLGYREIGEAFEFVKFLGVINFR